MSERLVSRNEETAWACPAVSHTMAFYSIEVPAGTYVVDKMKVVEATTHHTYWGNGFDWEDTVGPNSTTSQNFYFY